MPSFDIVSLVDLQEVDNAVNNTRKEIVQRFDFRNSKTTIDLNRKDKVIVILSEDEMKMKALRDLLIGNFVKRKVDPRSLDFADPEAATGSMLRREVKIKEGIDKDTARKIVALIKDAKLKVQTAIQDEQVRVTGKKIDDLQAVIALVKDKGLDTPLQYVNMKS
jgi:uncharacterized protein YajQ (UPF0234 family)